nr:Fe-Mn family superoxide dismutase [Haloferax elongans]
MPLAAGHCWCTTRSRTSFGTSSSTSTTRAHSGARTAGGWALLVYDSFSNQLRNVVVDKHDQGALWGSHAILALDVWEHSYYHDYGPARGDFVSAFFEVVDWDEPAARYEQAVELFE